jgi:hypothetical protein
MKYDIFETDEERSEARKSLPDLIQHSGWKLVVRALDLNIEYFSEQLKHRIESKRDFENLEQLYALQDRIDDLKQMKDLPKTLAREALPEPEEEDQEIYD